MKLFAYFLFCYTEQQTVRIKLHKLFVKYYVRDSKMICLYTQGFLFHFQSLFEVKYRKSINSMYII